MNKLRTLLTPETESSLINSATLILRVFFGFLMMTHGWSKLMRFEDRADTFMNFLGLSGPISLGLVVFAEFFCALFVVLGLGTRLVVIPLIIAMFVAAFVAHAGDPIGRKETALLYMACFTALLILGSGKFSLDSWLFKRK